MRMLKLMALLTLTLAVGVAADHPITVSGGSPLRLVHDNWNPMDDHTLGSKVHTNTVGQVQVTSDGSKPVTIGFNGQQLEINLTYGSLQVNIITNKKGHDPVLKITGSFHNDFHRVDANTFESNVSDASIQGVTVAKAGVAQNIGPLSGHIVIAVSYK